MPKTSLQQQTVDVYNQTAHKMAEKFRNIGPRKADVALSLELAGSPLKPRILEIGCGDGRDAKELAAAGDWYLGIDIAEAFIDIARDYVPEAKFQVADAVTFDYPTKLDIVFAAASLLHLDKTEMKTVLMKVSTALNKGGVFFISLKYADTYQKYIKHDEYGERLFYFYNPKIVEGLAESLRAYEVAYTDRQSRVGANHTEWFTIILRRR